MKGQRARSGGRRSSPIEGGRTTIMKQTPKKKGFRSVRPAARAVNLNVLEKQFEAGATVDRAALLKAGVIERGERVKLLASGKLTKKLQIKGLPLSAAARAAIEKQGGSVVE